MALQNHHLLFKNDPDYQRLTYANDLFVAEAIMHIRRGRKLESVYAVCRQLIRSINQYFRLFDKDEPMTIDTLDALFSEADLAWVRIWEGLNKYPDLDISLNDSQFQLFVMAVYPGLYKVLKWGCSERSYSQELQRV